MHSGSDGLRYFLLEGDSSSRILIFYGDQDGVVSIVQIALLHHGTDQCVDGNFQAGAGQIHGAQYIFSFVIASIYSTYDFLCVHGEGQAGIYIQKDDGVDLWIRLGTS